MLIKKKKFWPTMICNIFHLLLSSLLNLPLTLLTNDKTMITIVKTKSVNTYFDQKRTIKI